jgi:hypothetical protein
MAEEFHQYQQTKQPHHTSYNRAQKKTTTYDIGNPSPGLGQAQKCGEVKIVKQFPSLPFIIKLFTGEGLVTRGVFPPRKVLQMIYHM